MLAPPGGLAPPPTGNPGSAPDMFALFCFRAPEDGYYLFTLTIRENGDNDCAGIVRRTPATDPTNTVDLCKAEQGDGDWQTGSCSVCLSQGVG